MRILICTSAFEMGVNWKNISQIIHFGLSKSIESFVQECGRARREEVGNKCYILYNSLLLMHVTDEMKRFLIDKKHVDVISYIFCSRLPRTKMQDVNDVYELECICDSHRESSTGKR